MRASLSASRKWCVRQVSTPGRFMPRRASARPAAGEHIPQLTQRGMEIVTANPVQYSQNSQPHQQN